jgi:hypothetical protein
VFGARLDHFFGALSPRVARTDRLADLAHARRVLALALARAGHVKLLLAGLGS